MMFDDSKLTSEEGGQSGKPALVVGLPRILRRPITQYESTKRTRNIQGH